MTGHNLHVRGLSDSLSGRHYTDRDGAGPGGGGGGCVPDNAGDVEA